MKINKIVLNKIDYLNRKMPANPKKNGINKNNEKIFNLLNNMIDNYIRYQLKSSNNHNEFLSIKNKKEKYYRTIYYRLIKNKQIAKILRAVFVYYIDNQWFSYYFGEPRLKYTTLHVLGVEFKVFLKEWGDITAEGQQIKLSISFYKNYFQNYYVNFYEFKNIIKNFVGKNK